MINPLSLKVRNRINLTHFIITLFILGGCVDGNTVYHSSRDVSVLGWHPKDTLLWTLTPPDTTLRYAVGLNIRHDNSYAYQNIGLEITVQKGDTLISCDTLNLSLTDSKGNWNGHGWGSLYETSYGYKEINFPMQGSYTFLIRPCMNDWDLKGVTSVGLSVRRDQ